MPSLEARGRLGVSPPAAAQETRGSPPHFPPPGTAALETGAMSVFRPEVYFRWYCTIIPRLGVGQMGGFEFSTGIQSTSSFPEDDAAFLRFVVEANSEP